MNLAVLNEINDDFIKKYNNLLDIIDNLESSEIEKINSLCTYVGDNEIILIKLIILYNIKVNLGDKFNDFILGELNKISDKKAERAAIHAEAVRISNSYKDSMIAAMIVMAYVILVLLAIASYYISE